MLDKENCVFNECFRMPRTIALVGQQRSLSVAIRQTLPGPGLLGTFHSTVLFFAYLLRIHDNTLNQAHV